MDKSTIIGSIVIVCVVSVLVIYALLTDNKTVTPITPPTGATTSTLPSSTNGNPTVILHTEKGDIAVELLPQLAPGHVENFLKLARSGFYDGTRFHRVIPGFMIQGGDPLTKDEANRAQWGTGGPGYSIAAEFSSESHKRGILSMARSPAGPNTAGSQFFIVVADSPFLDGDYTVFGRVLSGMEVADAIVTVPAKDDLAINPVVLTSVAVQE